jgi:hypothetical protein
MAGLDDLNASIPDGKSALGLGDNAIRLVITKLLEYAAIEHALTGEHTFGVGTIAQRPAAGHKGRFYILTTAGVAVELQYDTGSGWATLTNNQAVVNYAEGLASHANASVLAHPDGSVTAAKIKAGAIHKGHLNGTTSVESIASLVGGAATSLHHHDAGEGSNGMTTFSAPGAHTVTFPPGVYRMFFTIAAGGGAGGAGDYGYGMANPSGGGGGGAGAEIRSYPVTRDPGTVLDIYVGRGGVGFNDPDSAGGNGVDSWIIGPGQVFAPGGIGGGGGKIGGGGGASSNGLLYWPAGHGGGNGGTDGLAALPGSDTCWYDGGAGGTSDGGAIKYGGGGGAASFQGLGGNGSDHSDGAVPTAGGVSAGGGGGAGRHQGEATFGGDGGDGLIIVTW